MKWDVLEFSGEGMMGGENTIRGSWGVVTKHTFVDDPKAQVVARAFITKLIQRYPTQLRLEAV